MTGVVPTAPPLPRRSERERSHRGDEIGVEGTIDGTPAEPKYKKEVCASRYPKTSRDAVPLEHEKNRAICRWRNRTHRISRWTPRYRGIHRSTRGRVHWAISLTCRLNQIRVYFPAVPHRRWPDLGWEDRRQGGWEDFRSMLRWANSFLLPLTGSAIPLAPGAACQIWYYLHMRKTRVNHDSIHH
jgi:hypothetical protein